jgi:hypothetical protein
MKRFMNPTTKGGHIFWGLLSWAGSAEWGTWWLGIWRWRLLVKAPWNEPVFSERYGYTKTLRIGGGWRVQSRLVP